MSAKQYFEAAQQKMRASLAVAPRSLAALVIAASAVPAQAGDYEYMARTIGNAIGSGSSGGNVWSNPTTRAVTVVTETLMGRLGRSMDEVDQEKRRQSEEDARIVEQARRDALYEAARRRELERQGIPYQEISNRGASAAGGAYSRVAPSVFDAPSVVRNHSRY